MLLLLFCLVAFSHPLLASFDYTFSTFVIDSYEPYFVRIKNGLATGIEVVV